MAACRLPGTLAAALALAACAAEPPAAGGPATALPLAGEWVVTDVLHPGRPGEDTGALLGQRLRFGSSEATDLLGRTCTAPSFRQAEISEGAFLGSLPRQREFPELRRPLAVTEVVCASEPFGLYAQWRDGSLMARPTEGMLTVRLDRPEAVPARLAPPVVAAATPTAKAEAPREAPAAAQAPVPAGAARQVYLASYRDEKGALKGWAVLKGKSPAVAAAKPVTKAVDLAGKGKFVRLFAMVQSDAQAKKLCSEVKKQAPDCGAAGRS